MRRALAAVALVALSAGPARAQATVAELGDRVEEARRLAEAGESAPTEASMDRVRSALGLPDDLVIQGRTVRMPADPVLARLRGTGADDFRAAARHLEALASRLGEGVEPVDRAALREDLEAAYGTRTEREPGLVQRMRELVRSFFAWLGRGAGDTLRGGPGLLLLVLVAAVAAVVLLRRGAFRLAPEGAAAQEAGGRSPADWRRLAAEARGRGDLAEAIACLYRALVSDLASAGVIEDHPSLTAREVRLATAGDLRLARATADASRRYEAIRYGGVTASLDDVASLERAERAARAG